MSQLDAKAARKAKYPGQVFFEGRECPECRGTRRYVASGQCEDCTRLRMRARQLVHGARVEATKRQRRAAIAAFYEGSR